jgi:hypothetical protein
MNDIILANNRFLGKTNPTMAAAVADGGSVLDREYIQRCARQIVDQGQWDNLKLWIDPGLAKLRNSGGIDYVPKAYDLSGNDNDGIQATESNQPVWGATGMTFDGSNDWVDCGNDNSLRANSNITVMMWLRTSATNNSDFIARSDTTLSKRCWTIYHSTQKLRVQVNATGGTSAADRIIHEHDNAINDGEWHHVCFSFSANTLNLYIDTNNTNNTVIDNGTVSSIYDSDVNLTIGARLANSLPSQFSDADINDIRIYNTALTATEIAAIYNQTSYRYA